MEITQKGRLWQVPCSPSKSVMNTSIGDRAIGRMVKANTADKPDSDATADLVGDIFFSLFRQNASTIDEPDPARSVNKTLIDWTLDTPDFQSAKANAASNLPVSLASSGILWSNLTSQDALKEALEKQKQAEEKQKEAEQKEEEAENLESDADEADTEEEANDMREQAKEAKQEAEQLREQAAQIAQQAADKVEKLKANPLAQGMVKQAAQEAKEKGEEVSAVMKGWGMEPGQMTFEDATDVIDMVNQSDKTMAKLAEMIGRLQGVSRSTSEGVKAGYTGTVTEPALTNDIARLFPTERAYLSRAAPPYLRAQYVSRLFAGGGLLGWKPRFDAKKKGSFVALVDRSGSMSGDDLTTAKAIGLGIAKSLADDDSITERKYRMTYFQSKVDESLTVSDKDDWRAHVEWAKVGVAGGTDFNLSLEYAIKIVHELKDQGVMGADILFITDGQARVDRETTKKLADLKAELGTRLITVMIGYGWSDLEGMSDLFVRTGDLVGDAESLVEQITANIVRADMA